MKFLFKVFCLLVMGYGIFAAKYPSNLPKCKNGDTDCLKNTITDIMKMGAKGIPSIDLVPLDPIKVDHLVIEQGGSSPVNIVLTFWDSFADGLSNMKMDRVVGFAKDPTKSKVEFYASFSKPLSLRGRYNITGQVLVLPITGSGYANITLVNVKSAYKFLLKLEIRNGRQYVQIDKSKFTFTYEKAYIELTNLFNDKSISDSMNIFLNENSNLIVDELKPGMADAFTQMSHSVINNVFNKIPYDDLFLPSD